MEEVSIGKGCGGVKGKSYTHFKILPENIQPSMHLFDFKCFCKEIPNCLNSPMCF